MKSFKVINRQAVILAIAFATALSAFMPMLASADTVTGRSIGMSSAAKSAAAVTYNVKFTAPTAAGAVVVNFCTDPTIGITCTAPTGMDASAAASASAGVSGVTKTANSVTFTKTIAATSDVDVEVTGITNPSTIGAFYARIVTYDTAGNAASYTATDLGTGVADQGSVALSTSDTIGVSGAVLESLVFCVAKNVIAKDCDLTTVANPAPVVTLGQAVGDATALQPGVLSTGSVYTQLSTNAVNGAVVSLKSNATGCGGLMRAGAPAACDIAPALATDVLAGDAKFGVKLATVSDATGAAGADLAGTLQPAVSSIYNTSTYSMNWVTGDATGVTGVYGDKFIDSNSAPVSNKNMELTFAASVNNSTPAGSYSADLSLIATGKF